MIHITIYQDIFDINRKYFTYNMKNLHYSPQIKRKTNYDILPVKKKKKEMAKNVKRKSYDL